MNPFIPIHGRITSYGYAGDSTPDTNSTNGIGAFDNHLQDGFSLAISRDVEHEFRGAGIRPQEELEIELHGGTVLKVRWDDRTAKSFNQKPLEGRFDLYSKHGPSVLVDRGVTGFRKI